MRTDHIRQAHMHLADALLSLSDAVAAAEKTDLGEFLEIARLLTAAQQRLSTASRKVPIERRSTALSSID